MLHSGVAACGGFGSGGSTGAVCRWLMQVAARPLISMTQLVRMLVLELLLCCDGLSCTGGCISGLSAIALRSGGVGSAGVAKVTDKAVGTVLVRPGVMQNLRVQPKL